MLALLLIYSACHAGLVISEPYAMCRHREMARFAPHGSRRISIMLGASETLLLVRR